MVLASHPGSRVVLVPAFLKQPPSASDPPGCHSLRLPQNQFIEPRLRGPDDFAVECRQGAIGRIALANAPFNRVDRQFQNVFGRRFMTRAKATFVFWWSRRKDPTSACKRVPEVRRRTVGHEIARSVSPSCLRSESAAAPAYSCRRPWLAEPASVRPRWTSSASRGGARRVRRGSYRRRRSSVDYGP
jgi:hypothetical protein